MVKLVSAQKVSYLSSQFSNESVLSLLTLKHTQEHVRTQSSGLGYCRVSDHNH